MARSSLPVCRRTSFKLFMPVMAAPLFCGCLSPTMYVDSTLGDVAPNKMHKAAHPAPVELLFEFQSKGSLNTRATDLVRPDVLDAVQKSAAFSQVSTAPVPNGAILNIVINDVPQEDAASKGFVTGLTFGASGTVVADYYVCTAQYAAAAGAVPISKQERHTIYTTIGNADAPPHAVKAQSQLEAVHTMARQLVSHVVDDLVADPALAR